MANLLRLLFWLAVAATLYFTLRTVTVHVPGSDKTQHAVTFAGLMLLAGLGYRRANLPLLAFALSGLGALIEFIQPWFGRDKDVKDWVADTIGILVALALLWAWRHLLGRRRNRG